MENWLKKNRFGRTRYTVCIACLGSVLAITPIQGLGSFYLRRTGPSQVRYRPTPIHSGNRLYPPLPKPDPATALPMPTETATALDNASTPLDLDWPKPSEFPSDSPVRMVNFCDSPLAPDSSLLTPEMFLPYFRTSLGTNAATIILPVYFTPPSPANSRPSSASYATPEP